MYMATFILAIVIMCNRYLFLLQSFIIHTGTCYDTIYTWRSPLAPLAPFADPLCSLCWLPFVPFSTYLAPSSCDRNRPPPSQVACKLTLFAPPFTQSSLPLQIPRTPTNPTAQRLPTTTLGLFRSHYTEQYFTLIVALLVGFLIFAFLFISRNTKRYESLACFAKISLVSRNKNMRNFVSPHSPGPRPREVAEDRPIYLSA
jgi:hypothetical protein